MQRDPQLALDSRDIVALMSAYNEGDVIYHVIGDLIEQGVKVYLIDNCSTDNTVAEASKWLGKGLIKIERFPDDVTGYSARCTKEYVWREILRRKEELAAQLGAGWYLHVDADEFRESPWPGKTLAQAIRQVDTLGYSAINFELLNFRPVNDDFIPGEDVRRFLTAYEPCAVFDAMQIKAWKNPGTRVSIVNNGGHSINFPGRRVFPLMFILRHYPIRGETHGRRKVFQDRVPRFAPEEVAMTWHIQYNEYVHGGAKFLHRPEALVPYDSARVRAELLGRFSEDVLLLNTLSGNVTLAGKLNGEALCDWMGRRLSAPQRVPLEYAAKAEQALGTLLVALEQKKEVPISKIDGRLRQLLEVVLEAKLAMARVAGDSHFTNLAVRLQQLFATTVGAASEVPPPEVKEPANSSRLLVSICIPTFNGEQFLKPTIESALAQTYPELEIVIVDDGSSDATVAVADDLMKGARVPARVLKYEHVGRVENWNRCLREARGKYIKFLCQDDVLQPDCVEKLVEVAERDSEIGVVFAPRTVEKRSDIVANAAIVALYRERLDAHKGWTRLLPLQPGTALLREPKLLKKPLNKIGELTSVLLAKAAIEKIGEFDPCLEVLADLELWLRVMTSCKIGFVDSVLSCSRLTGNRGQPTPAEVQRFYAKLGSHGAFESLWPAHRAHARQAASRTDGAIPPQPATAGV